MTTDKQVMTADEQIAACIKDGISFLVDAGAGAGKTYSLVGALRRILRDHSVGLRERGQKVACITFTNVAKDEIGSRINLDPLVVVSTIHDFLWTLIAPHQKELRAAVLVFNDGLKVESSRKVPAVELAEAIADKRIAYADLGTNLRKGRLFHDDLISVARIMFEKHPRLAQIVAAKFPFLLVDEYQDTSRAVIDIILGVILPAQGAKFVVGFFGDKMQSIFGAPVHPGVGEIPEEYRKQLKQIVKPDNRRCPIAVIDVLNHIRDDIEQFPADDNPQGEAVYISAAPEGGLDLAEEHLRDQRGWSLDPATTKQLLLTHKLIARKAGYLELVEIYGDRGGFFREDLLGGEDRTISFFIEKVEALVAAWQAGRHGQAITILKQSNFRLGSIAEKGRIRAVIEELAAIRNNGTVRDVLVFLRDAKLFDILEDLIVRLEGQPQPIVDDAVDAKYREADEKFYDALLALPYSQVIAFVAFFLNHTPFATKHGVKGAEYDDVIVVLDDRAKWHRYSFDRYLSDADLETNPGRWRMTRNLLYVACSRPKKKLAVIDLTPRSDAKLDKMRTWFGKENVAVI